MVRGGGVRIQQPPSFGVDPQTCGLWEAQHLRPRLPRWAPECDHGPGLVEDEVAGGAHGGAPHRLCQAQVAHGAAALLQGQPVPLAAAVEALVLLEDGAADAALPQRDGQGQAPDAAPHDADVHA